MKKQLIKDESGKSIAVTLPIEQYKRMQNKLVKLVRKNIKRARKGFIAAEDFFDYTYHQAKAHYNPSMF